MNHNESLIKNNLMQSSFFVLFGIFCIFTHCRRVSEEECTEIRANAEYWKPRVDDKYNDADLIVNGLYLGNVCAAHNDSWLDQHKITMVISVAKEWSDLPYKGERKIDFHYFDVDDSVGEDAKRVAHIFDEIALLIHTELRPSVEHWTVNRNTITPVILVHCNMGISRSTSVVLTYLQKYHLTAKKKSYSRLLRLVKTRRPVAKPNNLFGRILTTDEL
jgi:hypothetical protein